MKCWNKIWFISETFWHNPQYRITLEYPDEGDDKCTVIIALLQKNRRAQRRTGAECLCIGFAVYHVGIECDYTIDCLAHWLIIHELTLFNSSKILIEPRSLWIIISSRPHRPSPERRLLLTCEKWLCEWNCRRAFIASCQVLSIRTRRENFW